MPRSGKVFFIQATLNGIEDSRPDIFQSYWKTLAILYVLVPTRKPSSVFWSKAALQKIHISKLLTVLLFLRSFKYFCGAAVFVPVHLILYFSPFGWAWPMGFWTDPACR
ncbi:hypothetical protein AAC387_Pa07g2922 [Persea americana]